MHILPSVDYLRDTFSYNPLTGRLHYRKRASSQLPIDSPAGCKQAKYFRIKIKGVHYMAHRVIYKWLTGIEPGPLVEHRDDNGFNNCAWNLLSSDHRRNYETRFGSIKGYCRQSNGYQVSVSINGVVHYIGYYPTEREASIAYASALESKGA